MSDSVAGAERPLKAKSVSRKPARELSKKSPDVVVAQRTTTRKGGNEPSQNITQSYLPAWAGLGGRFKGLTIGMREGLQTVHKSGTL